MNVQRNTWNSRLSILQLKINLTRSKNEHYNIKMHYNEHSKSCMKPRRISRSTDSYSLQNATCSQLLDRTDWFKPRTKTRIHIQTKLSTQEKII